QYLEEADRLADRLAVIEHGKVIAEGTSRELKQSVGGRSLQLRLVDAARAEEARALLAEAPGNAAAHGEGSGSFRLRTPHAERVPQALAALAAGGLGIAEFSLAQPSLDDVFFALTGHAAEERKTEEAA